MLPNCSIVEICLLLRLYVNKHKELLARLWATLHFLRGGNPPVHGSPWHTWSQSETGVPPALNHEGINVQRVGTSLNITLSTPLDFSSRSRSLHDVLNSISGEMARLAVRPSHLEILDPLSSAKAILWLGDGSFQATAPAEFSVRNQTIWSLDGRNARASFWSNAVCMSIGESLATSGTFLSRLDTAEPATVVIGFQCARRGKRHRRAGRDRGRIARRADSATTPRSGGTGHKRK